MTEKIKIPANFWQELETVYNSEKQSAPLFNINKDFWVQLNNIYLEECYSRSGKSTAVLNDPKEEDLVKFQTAINYVLAKSFSVVEKERELNPDHPLFMPFSLFEPMGREQSEVHYTKTLAWFMEDDHKSRKHGFGAGVFDCLFPLFYNENFDSVVSYSVQAEKCEVEERKNRFDIKIDGKLKNGKDFIVVIEAKINAEEGEEQLKRYEEQCSKDTKLVFLTPDGREPKTTKDKSRWKFISWQQIAIKLLRFMGSYKNKAEKPEGFHLLKYFTAGIIREIDGAGVEDNPINLISYINKLKGEQKND